MVVSNWATAGMWSVQHCASTNQWVIFFLLNTHYSNSRAHPYGSNIIFPLEPLIPTFVILEAATEVTREKGGGACMRKGESLICMSAPLSRRRESEAGRQRGRGGAESVLVQLFKDLLTGFLLRCPRSLWSRQHTFLPLIAADETLMCLCLPSTWHMQTPQIQATAMCCGQLQHAKPRQGLDQTQMDPDPAQF